MTELTSRDWSHASQGTIAVLEFDGCFTIDPIMQTVEVKQNSIGQLTTLATLHDLKLIIVACPHNSGMSDFRRHLTHDGIARLARCHAPRGKPAAVRWIYGSDNAAAAVTIIEGSSGPFDNRSSILFVGGAHARALLEAAQELHKVHEANQIRVRSLEKSRAELQDRVRDSISHDELKNAFRKLQTFSGSTRDWDDWCLDDALNQVHFCARYRHFYRDGWTTVDESSSRFGGSIQGLQCGVGNPL